MKTLIDMGFQRLGDMGRGMALWYRRDETATAIDETCGVYVELGAGCATVRAADGVERAEVHFTSPTEGKVREMIEKMIVVSEALRDFHGCATARGWRRSQWEAQHRGERLPS